MATYPELIDKAVVVTGAGRGIGLAIARRFVAEGARVLLTDIAEGDSAEVEQAIARAVELFGRLDCMVCNAGICEVAPLVEASEASFDRQMTVNAKGAFLAATAAARQMLRQGDGGRIIINASGAGKMAPGKEAPLGVYAMSKHAVVGLTRQLGVELAADGILVNCICGGIVDTGMWDVIDRGVTGRSGAEPGSFKAEAVASVPIGRIQRPEDMANVVVYLAGDDADYIAGQTLNVSGGRLPY
ncbi:Sorbitol dehydrogenase [Geodia barretti]|uniref:3-ketoacyl-[acyl-carrier-protein] reductase beta subunit n=1 Tax=Geodia barretti TaxID=519541 RepID=A0AA35XMU4_GEOBA|nr:Sorbitol dehydrogenase [Geodia barretti]